MKVDVRYITTNIINNLWSNFILRVPYANIYNELISKKKGTLVNDHLAFRTLNTHTGEQPEGIRAISHIIKLLEYKLVDRYEFPQKKLTAAHYQHPDKLFPKIFISQLEVSKLPMWAQILVNQSVKETPYMLSEKGIELMNLLRNSQSIPYEAAQILIDDLVKYFQRPWNVPLKETILKLNEISHYAVWVLLHGNSVSHFSALVNYDDPKYWVDIESTCKELKELGVPMKSLIEGKRGSKLRQSATQAIIEEVEVLGDDGIEKIPWTYGYYGLVQRGFVGKKYQRKLFQGFVVNQSRHLFDITNTLDN